MKVSIPIASIMVGNVIEAIIALTILRVLRDRDRETPEEVY